MPVAEPSLLDSFSVLADPTRCRMLWLLDGHELTVSEICAVLQLPQSTVSRHLKTLADAEWVSSRRDGTSRYYSLTVDDAARRTEDRGPRTRDSGPTSARGQIWSLTREQLKGRPGVEPDARRLARVLARRSEASQQFFTTASGQWDRLRAELFGQEFACRALVALLPQDWVVGDLGCGTGAMLSILSPNVARVIGIDGSEEMLNAARRRLGEAGLVENVELRHGPLESLPIPDGTLDAATMMLVLHHLPSPAAAVAEAARVLKAGGRLLIVDMVPHEREEYRHQMGHVWLGFSEEQMRRWLTQAGFGAIRIQPLPQVDAANGPALFAAAARKP